jgi:hypothetical protein
VSSISPCSISTSTTCTPIARSLSDTKRNVRRTSTQGADVVGSQKPAPASPQPPRSANIPAPYFQRTAADAPPAAAAPASRAPPPAAAPLARSLQHPRLIRRFVLARSRPYLKHGHAQLSQPGQVILGPPSPAPRYLDPTLRVVVAHCLPLGNGTTLVGSGAAMTESIPHTTCRCSSDAPLRAPSEPSLSPNWPSGSRAEQCRNHEPVAHQVFEPVIVAPCGSAAGAWRAGSIASPQARPRASVPAAIPRRGRMPSAVPPFRKSPRSASQRATTD